MLKKLTTLWILLLPIAYFANSQSNPTDSLLNLLKTAKEDTNMVNLYREVGISIIYQNPPAAIPYFKKAIQLAKRTNFYPGLERNYAATSTAFAFNARYDSAKFYIDTAIFYALKVGDVNRLALVYLNRADALENLQDLTEAMKNCDTAMRYAEQSGNKDRLARIYNIVSDIYEQQNQHDASMEFLDKAVVLHEETGNVQMIGMAFFDKAILFRKMKKTDMAIASYKRAIVIADSVNDISNLSAYHGDLASTLIELKRFKEAEPIAHKALQYARQVGNIRQEAVIHQVFYDLYFAQNNLPSAIASGLAAYAILKEQKDLSREQGISSLLAEAYFKVGKTKDAYQFLKISRELNDSLLKQQFNEETAQLQTRFNVAQKDKEINLLTKDSELQQQKLSRQRILIAGSVVLILLSIVGVALVISRNRLRQKMKELELRNQIAADLHDEVGSSLSSINMLSQMASRDEAEEKFKKEILQKMSTNANETMEKMSDIVWMIKPGESEGLNLKERMQRFLFDICSSRNVQCSFDGDALDEIKLTMQQRKNIYLIFKEAVNNAVKYSGTQKITVKAQSSNGQIALQVKDEGNGFDSLSVLKGHGLNNMENRAKELHGTLNIHSKEKEGTEVDLRFPI